MKGWSGNAAWAESRCLIWPFGKISSGSSLVRCDSRIEKRLTEESFNSFAEWFFAGLTRVTGTVADETESMEVNNMSSTSAGGTKILPGLLSVMNLAIGRYRRIR